MNAKLDALRKKLDERLSRIERRVAGCEPGSSDARPATIAETPAVPAEDMRLQRLMARVTGQAAEKEDLLSRVTVQKREIDHLKAQLAEQVLSAETARSANREQQANIAKLLGEWEARLEHAEQELGAHQRAQSSASVERQETADEVAFLKAENEANARCRAAWEKQKAEYENALQNKDREIARLFLKTQSLEEENTFLIKKMGALQLQTGKHAVRLRRENASRHDKETGLLGWLAKPLVTVKL